MYKIPKPAKKIITRMKRTDAKLWPIEKIKKEDIKFTKEAKIVRNIFFKEKHEKLMEKLLNPKGKKIKKR